ncbi:50S ribosomal protein L25 [bacterium]|nr:50S ribosomal protein L25 [bacterium]
MTIELNATLRTNKGKIYNKKLKKQAMIPAVIYGKEVETKSIQVVTRDVEAILRSQGGLNSLINLKVAEDNDYTVLIKAMQGDPVTRALYHIDLWAVKADQEVSVSVEVRVQGRAAGQVLGGILEHVSHTVSVLCHADAIPEYILVDVTEMEIGQNIKLSSVQLPEGVRAKEGYDPTLVAIVEEKKAEEVTPVEGAEGVDGVEAAAEGDAKPAEGDAKAGEAKKEEEKK